MYNEKLEFNEDCEIPIPLTEISKKKNGIVNYNIVRRHLSQYFNSNNLDSSIINHLYGVLLNFESHFTDRTPTIRELITKFNQVHEGDIDFDLNDMFSGVNKSLKAPLLLLKGVALQNTGCNADQSLHKNFGSTSVVGYHPDEVVRFNPNNLVKVLGYPIKDAKALFSNFNVSGQPLYIPKDQTLGDRVHTMAICHFSDPPMHCWHIDGLMTMDELSQELLDEQSSPDFLESIFKDVPLPITDLKLWRLITQEWYEREKGYDWHKLSSQAQKRHLVNNIRHGSIGYSQCYTNLPPDLSDLLHEAAFNRIMRQIANTFPFLRNECQNQWNYREENNLSWDSIEH